jgi:hypothetical protein
LTYDNGYRHAEGSCNDGPWSTFEMGQAAGHLSIDLIEGRKKHKEQHAIVEPEFVIRQSRGATRSLLA